MDDVDPECYKQCEIIDIFKLNIDKLLYNRLQSVHYMDEVIGDKWHDEILTLEGKEAVEFFENDQKEVKTKEKEDLLDALKYYQDTCKA